MNDEYHLLANNCVTATSRILNCLDSKIIPRDMVVPWNFDAQLKKYCGSYAQESAIGQFVSAYQKDVHNQSFARFRTNHWTNHRIVSEADIIKHSYDGGERTKSTLIKMGWVVEDQNKILRAGPAAPRVFATGLEEYNRDYEKVQDLKKLYKENAGPFSRHAREFFKDNPDYETALGRIKAQAAINPDGASAKVMKIVTSSMQKDMRAELRVGRESRAPEIAEPAHRQESTPGSAPTQ